MVSCIPYLLSIIQLVHVVIDVLLKKTKIPSVPSDFEKPLFKQGLTSINDLKVGTVLTGRVTNTTHFGAFVDIGVGKDALLHNSQVNRAELRGKAGLELGDRVEVSVNSIERERGRIGLRLRKLL